MSEQKETMAKADGYGRSPQNVFPLQEISLKQASERTFFERSSPVTWGKYGEK